MPVELMDRSKSRSSCEDELALVKAAAWAWYQHSTLNDTNPTREFDLAKSHRQPRPSRYKLEAAAAAAAAVRGAVANVHPTATSSEPSSPPRSPASPSLLDPYEIERITRHLDRLIVSTRGGGAGRQSRRAAPGGGKSTVKTGGFWIRHAVGLCGSRADVSEERVLVGGRRSPGFHG